MKPITVLGSLNMDLIVKVADLPKTGETIMAKGFYTAPGGKGANQAAALARMGAEVAMIGRVGGDQYGEMLLNSLKEEGVDLEYLAIDEKAATGIALITVEDNGQNTIVVHAGANGLLLSEEVESATALIKKSEVLVAQLETPISSVELAFEIAKKYGVLTILNPAPAREVESKFWRSIDYLIPNETELAFISGEPVNTIEQVKTAAKVLLAKGAKRIIVTLGEQGAIYIDSNTFFHVPAPRVKAVDATAAGDTFVAAFAVKISEGEEIREAITFACHAGALTTTKVGALPSIPFRKEVEDFRRVSF